MRIGFDLRPAWDRNSRRRGIGKYTWQLAQALSQINREHELYFLTRPGQEIPDWVEREVPLPAIRRPSRLNWLLDTWQLPRSLRRLGLDLFEATEVTAIPSRGALHIWAHIHDLIPYLFWDEVKKSTPLDFRLALKLARRHFSSAELIITDSCHSRNDLVSESGISEERIRVIHPACDPLFQSQPGDAAREQVNKKYGIPSPFLFYVGGSDFRKNLPRLVKAFAALGPQGFDGKLVLAGESFLWDIPEIRSLKRVVEQTGVTSRIVTPGYIPDSDLPLFYSACHAFVFPSLYEGFGLPVLEAVECGVVMAVSRSSSIPEVAGNAAEYFDPADLASLTEALRIVCFDSHRRQELRSAAAALRGRFSWDRSAHQLIELYGQVL